MMAGGLSSCLSIAMRMVGDAIRLDSQNCKKEAYCQYLSCCVYISQILKDDAWDKDIKLAYNTESKKLFKLIQQCQERALTIISTEESQTSNNPQAPYQPTATATPPGRPSMGVRTSSGQILNFPSPPSVSPSSSGGQQNLTRPSAGSNQDKRIMGHHLKVARKNTSNTDKTLTNLRRMSENVQIARAREEAIRKKVWERQQRLQQEANRRFASASVDSKEEQEQRALYTKILEFEQDMVWPRQLRAKLKEFPEDASLIKHIIDKIFSSKNHPLRQFLLQYQYHVYCKLLPLLKDVNFPSENQPDTCQDRVKLLTEEDDKPGENQPINDYDDLCHKSNNDDTSNINLNVPNEEPNQDLNIFLDLTNSKRQETSIENNELKEKKTIENDKKEICEEGVQAIVVSIMEDILKEVTKLDYAPSLNEKEEDKDIMNKMNVNIIAEDDKLACTTDETTPKDTTAYSCKGKLNTHKSLTRIKSFDVDSEFESLEEDMFDSESSEDEQNNSTFSDQNTSPVSPKEVQEKTIDEPKDTSNDNEVEHDAPSTSKEQSNSVLSYEEELEMTRTKLSEIFVDMRFFLEKLKGFIILAYEELATPVGHDQCYAAVEYPFFQPLWPLLLGVLRRVNFEKELSLGGVMTKKIQSSPAEMGVLDRLCLNDKESLKLSGNQFPYQSAIETLQKVATSYCPLEKLDYIVQSLRSICQCVEDYWEIKGKPRHCPETSMGCDDLLPVLTYIIVQSGMAQLVSECAAMEEFILEGYLMGEEGYCLTTLQTALSYLIQLDKQPDQLDENVQL